MAECHIMEKACRGIFSILGLSVVIRHNYGTCRLGVGNFLAMQSMLIISIFMPTIKYYAQIYVVVYNSKKKEHSVRTKIIEFVNLWSLMLGLLKLLRKYAQKYASIISYLSTPIADNGISYKSTWVISIQWTGLLDRTSRLESFTPKMHMIRWPKGKSGPPNFSWHREVDFSYKHFKINIFLCLPLDMLLSRHDLDS